LNEYGGYRENKKIFRKNKNRINYLRQTMLQLKKIVMLSK